MCWSLTSIGSGGYVRDRGRQSGIMPGHVLRHHGQRRTAGAACGMLPHRCRE